MSNHYLIHLPHCGLEIPNEFLNDYLLSKDELKENIYEYCDIYTDKLFSLFYKNFAGVKNSYSRLFFDPERFFNDKDETMHQQYKLGWFYENAIVQKKPLRVTKNKELIAKYYKAHHQKLNQLTAQKLARYNKCTIIDCHSFSNNKYWFQDKNITFPDICIGFDNTHVDKDLVQIIKDEFKEYKIGINTPYSGALVPNDYWQVDNRVKSVMIEINKKLYVEPDNITKNRNFKNIQQKLNNIANKLVI